MKLAEQMKALCECYNNEKISVIENCKNQIKTFAAKGRTYITIDGESVYPGTDLRKFLDDEGFEVTFENENVAYIIWKRES